MSRVLKDRDPRPGGMFFVSFFLHVVIFLIILKGPFLSAIHPQEAPVTYVDVVTLPVASPQSGTPAPSRSSEPAEASAAPPAAAPPSPAPAHAKPAKPEMALPTKKSTAKSAPPKEKPEKANAAKEAREATDFEKRMAKLEEDAEANRLNQQLSKFKSRAGRTGMPGGKGSQAGSDYTAYVRSRIQDAMNALGADHQSKSPMVAVTVTVGSDGRLSYRVDRSSGDRIFEDGVFRALTLAAKSIKAPPAGGQYKHGFVFTPEQVAAR